MEVPGNTIRYLAHPEPLYLSNGATSALFACLALAGALEASTLWDARCLTWLASHDPAVIGLGCAGFDLAHLAWSEPGLPAQRAFLLRTLERALDDRVWERLPFAAPTIELPLRVLRELVLAVDAAAPFAPTPWWPRATERCATHATFRGVHGSCPLCTLEASLLD